MSISFIKKSFVEVLILLAGAMTAAAGKRQDSPALFALGLMIIGLGIIWGGLRAIR